MITVDAFGEVLYHGERLGVGVRQLPAYTQVYVREKPAEGVAFRPIHMPQARYVLCTEAGLVEFGRDLEKVLYEMLAV